MSKDKKTAGLPLAPLEKVELDLIRDDFGRIFAVEKESGREIAKQTKVELRTDWYSDSKGITHAAVHVLVHSSKDEKTGVCVEPLVRTRSSDELDNHTPDGFYVILESGRMIRLYRESVISFSGKYMCSFEEFQHSEKCSLWGPFEPLSPAFYRAIERAAEGQ